MSTSMNRAHPANLALLTVATMGANAVAGCAPSVILAHLSAPTNFTNSACSWNPRKKPLPTPVN